jgi:hypothetical protein
MRQRSQFNVISFDATSGCWFYSDIWFSSRFFQMWLLWYSNVIFLKITHRKCVKMYIHFIQVKMCWVKLWLILLCFIIYSSKRTTFGDNKTAKCKWNMWKACKADLGTWKCGVKEHGGADYSPHRCRCKQHDHHKPWAYKTPTTVARNWYGRHLAVMVTYQLSSQTVYTHIAAAFVHPPIRGKFFEVI